MDRTTADKLASNVASLKNELDNYYLNGLTPEVTALAARICELAGGHEAELALVQRLETEQDPEADSQSSESGGIAEIAQNCLTLAIDRCDVAGSPLKNKRQRMIIKGAIRQMLEAETLPQKAEADPATDNWSTEYKQTVVNDLNELRESLAECQHGNDKLRESVRLHRRRANELAKRVQELERLLESLTPGGSEFAGSPEACARWVRRRLASVGKLAAERNRLREAARALVEAGRELGEHIEEDEWGEAFVNSRQFVAFRVALTQMQEATK